MFKKHIQKVKFYPSADDFTQALLLMLVTSIMSEYTPEIVQKQLVLDVLVNLIVIC